MAKLLHLLDILNQIGQCQSKISAIKSIRCNQIGKNLDQRRRLEYIAYVSAIPLRLVSAMHIWIEGVMDATL